MNRRLLTMSVVTLLLSVAAALQAGYQFKRKINRISYGKWNLTYESGVAGMSQQPGAWRVWSVSAPTIQIPEGQFLSGDPAGKAPSVVMVDKKSEYTDWAFEFLAEYKPEGVDTKRGLSGCEFRMMLANGPFKDWYVGLSELTEEQLKDPSKIRLRPLILVKEKSQATVFTYIDTQYWTGMHGTELSPKIPFAEQVWVSGRLSGSDPIADRP